MWSRDMPLPDPMSCLGHLNESERAAHEADRARWEAECLPFEFARYQLLNSDPACWSWPPPSEPDIAAWQDGRCAVCGRRDPLVTDHNHRTAMIRGLMCRSCNALEGAGLGGVFTKYRGRNPATICGVRERYRDPFTGELAEPTPEDADRWLHDVLDGVL